MCPIHQDQILRFVCMDENKNKHNLACIFCIM